MGNIISEQFYNQWKIYANWTSEYINELSDDDLKLSLAPGKNHGIWILGHLIQSEDELSKFLGKGDYLYPGNEELFGQKSRLKPPEEYPGAQTLRKQWKDVITKNDKILSEFEDKEWDEPQALKEANKEDFFNTKGRCIMIWNLHQMYHCGQLAILLSMAGKAKY